MLDLFCKRNNILTFYYASVRRNVNLENICYDLIAEVSCRFCGRIVDWSLVMVGGDWITNKFELRGKGRILDEEIAAIWLRWVQSYSPKEVWT